MTKDFLREIRIIKLIIVGTAVAYICAMALVYLWQRSVWMDFNQSIRDRSDAFSAKMEADFQARMAEEKLRAAKQEADFQARMAEQRRKIAKMEADSQARLAEERKKAARQTEE